MATDLTLEVFDTAEDFYAAALATVTGVLRAHEGEVFRVVLSGGSTPLRLYEMILEAGSDLDWHKVRVFFGDERTVPPDHPDSNFRAAYETLLDAAPVAEAAVFRMHCELGAEVAADLYEQTIRGEFQLQPGELPRFDLILLGMGADGHTASLFPGTPALEERERLVVANPVPQLNTTRLTLTYPVLNAARAVLFLVTGAEKAPALRACLTGDIATRPPAGRVQPTDGRLLWYVDRAAAAELA
jgi:6-phosphogluconolactonase